MWVIWVCNISHHISVLFTRVNVQPVNGSQKATQPTYKHATCIYHLKCKSLSLYSVQKSFYSPAHSLVTLSRSLSPMLGINMKLIDYCLRVWHKPLSDFSSLYMFNPPHVLWLLSCAVDSIQTNRNAPVGFDSLESVFKVCYRDKMKRDFIDNFLQTFWRCSQQYRHNQSFLLYFY